MRSKAPGRERYTTMGDNRWLKNSFVYLIILVAALALLFNYFNNSQGQTSEKGIYEVLNDAKQGKVDQIEAQTGSNDIFVSYRNDTKKYHTRIESDDTITKLLLQAGVSTDNVKVVVQGAPAWGGLLNIFTILLPFLLMIGFFIFFMRQAQGSNNQALSFGKSRARMFSGDKPTITFADVAGQEEAKQDLTEVVEFLKFPDKFAALGARIPRGVLMVGPPGTGKTLLSRAVAGEAGVPFFSISGSEFVEMFVGVGASRVRDLFDQAKRNAPCIVFIDEIDAVGRQRGAGLGGSHDEREQTLNQILVERRNRKVITQIDFEEALEKVSLGPERRSRVISEKEKNIVAYHEAGHALCFKLLKHTNPVHKISIVARGMAMGVTWSLPQEDRYFRTRKEFEDDIAAALGGWVAEQLHLGGDATTGASNDIEKATEMARQMVTKFGMSEKLGPLQYGKTDELIFLGRQIQEEKNYSEA